MSPEAIIAEVACITGVPVAAITGRRRTREVAYARFLAISAIREINTIMSFQRIVELFNRSEAATAMNACKRHYQLVKNCREYREWSNELNTILASSWLTDH